MASASEIFSPFPVPPEAITFISLCFFKYSVAVFILSFKERDGLSPYTLPPKIIT